MSVAIPKISMTTFFMFPGTLWAHWGSGSR